MAVTELACSKSSGSSFSPPRRRLRFFLPSVCGEFLDSSEVQSEVRLRPCGQPDPTCLSLRYHAMAAALLRSCWHCTAGDDQGPPQGRIMMVGGGGGCLAWYLHATLRPAVLDVVECEPAVVAIAHNYFAPSVPVPSSPVGLTWHTEDGVSFIARMAATESTTFDAVILDVSHASAAVPVQSDSKWDMAAPSPAIVAPAVLSGLASLTRCVLINVLPSPIDNDGGCQNDAVGRSRGRGPAGADSAKRCVQRIADCVAAAGFTCVEEMRSEGVSNRILLCRSETSHEPLPDIDIRDTCAEQTAQMRELLDALQNFEVRRVMPGEDPS